MFWYFSPIACFIDIHFPEYKNSMSIEEELIENQICTGYFEALTNQSYECRIFSSDGKHQHFLKQGVIKEKTHFSFNTDEAQTIVFEIKCEDEAFGRKIRMHFENDFDTFNKEVAKGVRVEPAVQALIQLEKLIQEVFVQTEARTVRLGVLAKQHGIMIRFVTFVSVMTLLLLAAVKAYDIYTLKKFFKKKKLI